jgi:hypothetical protein
LNDCGQAFLAIMTGRNSDHRRATPARDIYQRRPCTSARDGRLGCASDYLSPILKVSAKVIQLARSPIRLRP